MSSFKKMTKHPYTDKWEMAFWIDDYYGRHRYGVEFNDGDVFDPEKTELETKEEKKP